MKPGWILVVSLFSCAAAAQSPAPTAPTPMVKCADARGGITYSNVPCDKQGLKEVGQVADRTTVMPLGPAPKPAAVQAPTAKDAPRKDDPENLRPRGPGQATPATPLLEKLSK
jgi:hypothetical protein